MAPALTAEPLNPKEKLSSTATPATGTRQSVRKQDATSGAGIGSSDTAKTPIVVPAPATTQATTRVTRSKEAAKRTDSPIVLQVNNNNNKRKSNNNNHSEIVTPEVQMGLSAAPTHASSDGNAAPTAAEAVATSISGSEAAAPAAISATVTASEHNNNCKDTATAELLANLSDFGEAITAEICLRKTLPEVSISKEQPSATVTATVDATPATASAESVQRLELESMAEAAAQSQSTSAVSQTAATTAIATTTPGPVPVPESLQQLVGQDTLPQILSSAELAVTAAEITDNLEERLSQLDGSPNVVLPPIVEIGAASLEAGVALPTPNKQLQQQQQQQQEILTSPQHSTIPRQSSALLTPQSTGNTSVNFLKDGAAGAVLEDPDIEEVLKALKTFDTNQVNPDICDFNFFNDFAYNEEDTAAVSAANSVGGVGGTTTTTAATGATATRLDVEEKASCSGSISKPPRPLSECHAELELEQNLLDRRLDFMLRRIRKMQARHMCRHTSDEVAGILEWSARTSNKVVNATPVRSAKLTSQEDTVLSVISGRPGSNFWEEQTKHPLPASQMSNVLRHIETAARKQQICHTTGGGSASLASSSSWYSNAAQPGKRPRRSQPMDGIPSTSTGTAIDTMSSSTSRAEEVVPNFDAYVTSELTHVSGMLHTELREVQNAIDSDATESSSGGESADEMVNYNNSQQLSLPIAKRAVWRYSRDRANIALRWSWLCAQVADLDIKIRQHNDVYNDMCRSEGQVVLEATPSPKNGYKEQQQQQVAQTSSATQQEMDAEQASADHLCSRARPLVLSEFRKRKLFQTTNMHTISKKAARPSNIKCGCQWPQVPCTLCTGRPDPTAPRDLPETLMPQNRVALLDPGFHPVLSFTDDVAQSVHLEAIARQPDWQYRVMRGQAKAIVRNVFKAEREAIATNSGAGGRRLGEPVKRRAYVRRKERNNNNNKNNNNRSNSKETTLQINNNNNNSNKAGVGGGNVGLVDSGNGNKRQQQSATALLLSDSSQQQQQLNNSTSMISSNGNVNDGPSGNKKARKSTTSNTQQQPHSINNNNHNKNSRQASVGGNRSNNRSNVDPKFGKQKQNSRRSSESQGQRTKERRNRLVYDIDNIVIPYSMAAQNRIELLPYKEIPTPKWRIVDSDNDKKLQSDSAPPKSSTHQLNNSCVKGQATPSLQDSAKKTKSQTPASTTTKTTTATSKTEKDVNLNNDKQVKVGSKPSAKINGIKLSSKEKQQKQKDITKPVKQSEKSEQPLSNGLPNGKAEQKEPAKEKIIEPAKDQATDAKEPVTEQQQKQPAKPTKERVQTKQTTPINGKNQKHKINNNTVNNIKKANAITTAPVSATIAASAPAPVAAPAPALTPTPAAAVAPANKDTMKVVITKKVAVKPLVEPQEPPRKRPKLQLGPTEPLKPLKLPPPPSDDDVCEDISDEAYIVRHQRALLEERHRFETLLKFPYSKRVRSNRRVDSRAESSGTNTPDPASPATPRLAGPVGDNESIPSKLAHPLDAIASDNVLTATKRQERRRTTSNKLKDHDRRSATPDVRDPHLPLEPPPFKPLKFPLSDEAHQQLLTQMYAPPPQPTTAAVFAPSKRSKSKSVSSSNGVNGSSKKTRSRRSSKAKVTNVSKLAQSTTATKTKSQLMPKLNGSKNSQQHPVPHINGDNAVSNVGNGLDREQEEDDDEEEGEEDVELLLEDDDDHHHLAPPDNDNLDVSVADDANMYDATINAYISETGGWLEEEELADDPFMDDDPNDPEWKRSIGVRMRKRM